jgi:hypothetical protein
MKLASVVPKNSRSGLASVAVLCSAVGFEAVTAEELVDLADARVLGIVTEHLAFGHERSPGVEHLVLVMTPARIPS